MNHRSKRGKNGRNKLLRNKNAQKNKQLEKKKTSILAETGSGPDNEKILQEKRKIKKKYKVTNAREIAQLTETLKQKTQTKAPPPKRENIVYPE